MNLRAAQLRDGQVTTGNIISASARSKVALSDKKRATFAFFPGCLATLATARFLKRRLRQKDLLFGLFLRLLLRLLGLLRSLRRRLLLRLRQDFLESLL